jgi:uncharacterized membrane protein YeiB
MSSEGAARTPVTASRERIRAVDAARGTALVGMMAIHVLPATRSGEVTTAYLLASGRASALFAVLAGTGIALASGGRHPPAGERARRLRRAVAARAAVVAVVGLLLGGFSHPVAVILPYYGLLFLVALPVITWPARRLAVAAAACGLVTPVVSHVLRGRYDRPPGPNLDLTSLADPAATAATLLLTGYYPVLTWSTYLLAGMAVGRLPLAAPPVARRLVVAGVALAVAGWAAGVVAVRWAGGPAGLAATVDGATADGVGTDLLTSLFGAAPTTSWWWLGVAAPHSGTTPDLVHTGGTALAVLGMWLLVEPRMRRPATPLVAAGAMTLTLYTAHVVALGVGQALGWGGAAVAGRVLLVHLVVALAVATLVGSPRRRGPLENVSASVALLAAGEPSGARS